MLLLPLAVMKVILHVLAILNARVMVRVAKASPARLASITVLSNAIQQSYQLSGSFDVRISFSMLWAKLNDANIRD